MLNELHIENIAVIEKADIRFGSGFNVLTGETGAGKSIVIDSIGAVLGGRVSRELVRRGADKGTVTAVFINNTDKARSTTLALDGYTRHTTYVTDKDNDLAKTDSGTAADAFTLPARSVTTLVLEK